MCVPTRRRTPRKKYCPPIELEYIATALEGLVDTITLVDMRFELDIGALIAKYKTRSALPLRKLGLSARGRRGRRQAPAGVTVIFGGRHATTAVEALFADTPHLDVIVRGEGEEIIRDLANGPPREQITGISYRLNGGLVHNANRTLTRLDDDLLPDRTLRRADYRLLYKDMDLGVGVDFISTSRGCPFRCAFCTFSNNPLGEKRAWSGRSAASVVAELRTITASFVFVVDDNFGADMRRVEKICDGIQAAGIRKTFIVAVRLEIFKHPQILRKMFAAGFRILTIGIESAQDKTLNAMQKGFDTAQAEKAFAVIRKVGFFIHGYFIVGCLGETEAEMLEIAAFATRLKVDTIDLCLLRTETFSPLNALIAASGTYHARADGYVVSEAYDLDKLQAIRRHIRKNYYTLWSLVRIGARIIRVHPFSGPALLRLALRFLSLGLASRRPNGHERAELSTANRG
ncbi:MAG TPA: radical SAM protein [Candidatus Baltobacteraceae bacterium]|nr:radical SAM protein [Candidatus Baltobacteraceae bacterium]